MLRLKLVLSYSCFLWAFASASSAEQHLTLTALLSNNDGDLRFECWQIDVPFETYPTTGMAVKDFAEVTNVTYVVLPPRSSEGLHKPPHPMFFVLLSGLAHVTIPATREELWISEGLNGLMIAADTVGEGHLTEYPLDKETVALQIPFKDAKPPKHKIIHRGVCHANIQVAGFSEPANHDDYLQIPV